MTNEEFADGFAAALADFHAGTTTAEQFETTLAGLLNDWNDGSVTRTALAARISNILDVDKAQKDEFATWLAGDLTSGYTDDTGTTLGGAYYPLTNHLGVTRYVLSPEGMLNNLAGDAVQDVYDARDAAQASATAAAASATAAQTAETNAETAETNAETAQAAAEAAQAAAAAAKTAAETAETNAETAATTATTQAGIATTKASEADASATAAASSATAAQTAETNAEAAEAAAETAQAAAEAARDLALASAVALPWEFDTATADAAPAAGGLRFNDAAPGSVSFLYISDTTAEGQDAATFLGALDDSTTSSDKGRLRIGGPAGRRYVFRITGAVTAATGYVKVPVTPELWDITLPSAGDTLGVAFDRTGDKGDGSGDVTGPASSTDNAVPRFDGATGKLLQGSNVTIDDQGQLSLPSGQSNSGLAFGPRDGSGYTVYAYNPTGDDLRVSINGADRLILSASGALTATSFTNGSFSISGSGAGCSVSVPANATNSTPQFRVAADGSGLAASAVAEQVYVAFEPKVNQSGTAGYTLIKMDVQETSTGSGAKKLVDLKVNGVTKFDLDNAGNASLSGNLTVEGDLWVKGATVTYDVANVEIEDAVVKLAKANSAGAVGFIGHQYERGSAGDDAFFGYRESDDSFVAGTATADDLTGLSLKPIHTATASQGDNSTKAATTEYVDTALAALGSSGWTQIGSSVTVASPQAAVTFSNIPDTYSDLAVAVLGASHNSGSNQAFNLGVSSNGGVTTVSRQVSVSTHPASDQLWGLLCIFGYTQEVATVVAPIGHMASGNNMAGGGTANLAAIRTDGTPIDVVQLTWSSGNVDAGTFVLLGR